MDGESGDQQQYHYLKVSAGRLVGFGHESLVCGGFTIVPTQRLLVQQNSESLRPFSLFSFEARGWATGQSSRNKP